MRPPTGIMLLVVSLMDMAVGWSTRASRDRYTQEEMERAADFVEYQPALLLLETPKGLVRDWTHEQAFRVRPLRMMEEQGEYRLRASRFVGSDAQAALIGGAAELVHANPLRFVVAF